jgi:chemotaxis protein MotA
MFIIIGAIVVVASVLTGFVMAGGHPASLLHLSEIVTIGGASLGALIIMSPPSVLKDLVRGCLQLLKGTPYNRQMYMDLLRIVYGLATLTRRDGLLAIEPHISGVKDSEIFKKGQKIVNHHHALGFLTRALEMVVEGKAAEAITERLDQEIEVVKREHHAAISALSKTADALPGFGIVAAVLGIVVTMGAIDGPVEEIGYKVGAALVGTFLGILLSYGFFAPMAVRMEMDSEEECVFLHVVSAAVVAISQGASPKEAVNHLIGQLGTSCRPTPKDLEEIFTK